MKYSIENQQLELDLSLSKSSVIVEESEDESVEVDVTGLRKKTIEEFYKIKFKNNRLSIQENSGSYAPVLDGLFNAAQSSDIVIRIPAKTAVSGKISTIRGDIKSGKLVFNGELKTVTGKIILDHILSDRLDVQNIGGNIYIKNLQGFLKGKAVAGEFTVENGAFKEVAVKSVSGDVRLTGQFQLEEDGEISTVSGNIHLDIKQYQGEAKLNLVSLSGHTSVLGEYPEGAILIKPRLPFLKNHPFKSFVPSMKDMFSSFFSSTTEGDMEVETVVEKGDDENTKMILEMLSQGKISVEEAEKLIKALTSKK